MLLSLGVLELGARRLRSGVAAEPGAEIYRTPCPYLMFAGKPGAVADIADCMTRYQGPPAHVEMDEMGVRRDDRITQPKRPDATRIVVLGGSTVFLGSTSADTIPARLERLLHEGGRTDVEVFNFGVVSYVSGQDLMMLLHRVADLSPDMVIAYGGGNDIFTPFGYDPRPGYPYNFFMVEDAIATARGTNSWDLLSALAARSALVSLTRGQPLTTGTGDPLTRLREQVGYRSAGWEDRVVATYIGNLEKMAALAQGFGFKLAAVLQPMLHFKTPHVGRESQFVGDADFSDYLDRQYDRTRKAYVDLEQRHGGGGCHFIDISLCLRDCNRELYWDLIHTDNEGNGLIARAIKAALRERGLPPARASQ